MLALLAGAAATVLVLAAGVVVAVVDAVRSAGSSASSRPPHVEASGRTSGHPVDARDALADRPMVSVDEDAAHPDPVSTADPGTPIDLPTPTIDGPAGVPTGFPHTEQGALAQLAAIDQTALQSGSLQATREVIAAWAMPGGPTPESWSGVRALAEFFDSAGLSGGGTSQLAIIVTPLMGQIKGSVGADFTVPCVDFEVDVTLQQTTRGAAADCQRMQWDGTRWMVGPGAEPVTPPSVWPDTDTAISVGYRDLRPGGTR